MSEKEMPSVELGEKPFASARQTKVGRSASWVRAYGAKVLSERAPGVFNPSEAEMNAIVKDLRS